MMAPHPFERLRPEPEHAVLVVTPRGGALEAFARRASERWQVSLARDRLTALRSWGRAAPAVAVVELELALGADGLELCRELRGVARSIHLVLVTPLAAARQRVRALELGVDDCVPLPVDSDELCALVAARLGGASVRRRSARPASLTARVQHLARRHGLSPREVQLLLLVTRGEHPKAAAAKLGCGYSTARTHLRRMAKKLGCGGTRELLVRFFEREGGGEPELGGP